MKEYTTVTQGRSRRSNAGNRMRELLDKAKQEDEEKDELFAEEVDDGEFQEPAPIRDVFLDEFADTDDEAEGDDEDDESRLRREERRAKKGKGVFNPFVKIRGPGPSGPQPTAAELASLDPSIDVSKMAPSTLVLELRKQRREAKRLHRSEARRSNLRASTLRTEEEIIEKEKAEKIALASSRKGRKAQHETGEVRGARPMSQAELIAAALEEEERNKEALTQWLRREEEKRELRRVGRKRVRGPRWTFVSRTVGKLVEIVEDTPGATPGETPAETPAPDETPVGADDTSKEQAGAEKMDVDAAPDKPSEAVPQSATPPPALAEEGAPPPSVPTASTSEAGPSSAPAEPSAPVGVPSQPQAQPGPSAATAPSQPSQPASKSASTTDIPTAVPPLAPPKAATPSSALAPAPTTAADADADADAAPTGPYERNYLILSQVPGGLPAELRLILGEHVDWSDVKVIPARNRPINRKPPTDPLTGLPARYRHPESMVPYSSADSYQVLQALLDNRYVWTEGGWWGGGEGDVAAEGVEDIPGWREACVRGWVAGKRVGEEGEVVEEMEVDGEGEEGEGEQGEEGEEVEGEEGEGEGEGLEEEAEEEEEVVGKGKAKARRPAKSKARSKKKAATKKALSKAKTSAPAASKKAKSKRRR